MLLLLQKLQLMLQLLLQQLLSPLVLLVLLLVQLVPVLILVLALVLLLPARDAHGRFLGGGKVAKDLVWDRTGIGLALGQVEAHAEVIRLVVWWCHEECQPLWLRLLQRHMARRLMARRFRCRRLRLPRRHCRHLLCRRCRCLRHRHYHHPFRCRRR